MTFKLTGLSNTDNYDAIRVVTPQGVVTRGYLFMHVTDDSQTTFYGDNELLLLLKEKEFMTFQEMINGLVRVVGTAMAREFAIMHITKADRT